MKRNISIKREQLTNHYEYGILPQLEHTTQICNDEVGYHNNLNHKTIVVS